MRITLLALAVLLPGCATYTPNVTFTRHDLTGEVLEKTHSRDKSECIAAALSVFEENPVFGVYWEPYSGHDGGYYSVRAIKANLNYDRQMAEVDALQKVKSSRDVLYTQCMETRGWTKTSH